MPIQFYEDEPTIESVIQENISEINYQEELKQQEQNDN